VAALQYRYLFEQLVRRELRAKYKGSALGILWYLVNPIVLVAVYAIMFRYLLRAVVIDDYPLFLLIGLLVWTFFSQAALAAATSLVEQASLVRTVRFPRETLPAATVTVQLVPFAALLAIALVLGLALRDALGPGLLLLLPLAACLYVFVLGVALVVSVGHAHFRDVQPVLNAALLPWFFVTPIFFRIDDLPGLDGEPVVEALLRWGNPVAPFIEALRDILYYGTVPGAPTLLYVAGVTALVAAVGLAAFRRGQRELSVVL
jgi:ABC-type polysaccharide/polyol phosphate export permease